VLYMWRGRRIRAYGDLGGVAGSSSPKVKEIGE